MNANIISELSKETSSLSIQKTLLFLADKFSGKISFSTSFGMEDQVITDMIFSDNLPIRLFTLDTGRHFEETYKIHNRTLSQYDKKIQVYHPDRDMVEHLLTTKGTFSFYESLENRKECCHIRKVVPLGRALKGVDLWITGLRRSQSENRENLARFEFDSSFQVIKYNPLIDWSLGQVNKYINDHHVPYNILHDKGFASIGCAPCTRAIEPDQDLRAGRWWWETNSAQECGIHTNSNDKE